jgi:hypothetical protein
MPAPIREIGYATPYGVVVVAGGRAGASPELRWPLSIFVYDRMRRSDAQARRCCAR